MIRFENILENSYKSAGVFNVCKFYSLQIQLKKYLDSHLVKLNLFRLATLYKKATSSDSYLHFMMAIWRGCFLIWSDQLE